MRVAFLHGYVCKGIVRVCMPVSILLRTGLCTYKLEETRP